MSFFILEMVFFVSMGFLVYLVSRKLPLLEGFWQHHIQEREASPKKNKVASRVLDGADRYTNALFARSLRRAKLMLMKMDNWVGGRLENIREKNSADEQERPHVLRNTEEQQETSDKE